MDERHVSLYDVFWTSYEIMPVASPFDAAERHHLDDSGAFRDVPLYVGTFALLARPPFHHTTACPTNATSAYNTCRDFEEHATNNGTLRDLMNARILGYLILYSPPNVALHELVNVIHSCSKDYASLSALR